MENNSEIIKELTDILEQCDITNFYLDTSQKNLTLKYKEDFDRFFPKFNARPTTKKSGYGTPYDFGKVAFFDYKGWEIQSWLTLHKPED